MQMIGHFWAKQNLYFIFSAIPVQNTFPRQWNQDHQKFLLMQGYLSKVKLQFSLFPFKKKWRGQMTLCKCRKESSMQ